MEKTDFEILRDTIDNRFPNAHFTICCFKTVDEVENKILCDDELIIYADEYITNVEHINNKSRFTIAKDYFLIKKQPNKEHIYYYDVIDQLIQYNFVRNDCDNKFMENIRMSTNNLPRNNKSLKLCSSFWGS